MAKQTIKSWFEQAVPEPTICNLQVQPGCHFEEVAEMLAELQVETCESKDDAYSLKAAFVRIYELAELLKNGKLTVKVSNPVELLDSVCDQNVTGTGVAHMLGMDIDGALNEVNSSNWSKFVDGKPIFDDNGKIKKGPNYKEPELTQFVKNAA